MAANKTLSFVGYNELFYNNQDKEVLKMYTGIDYTVSVIENAHSPNINLSIDQIYCSLDGSGLAIYYPRTVGNTIEAYQLPKIHPKDPDSGFFRDAIRDAIEDDLAILKSEAPAWRKNLVWDKLKFLTRCYLHTNNLIYDATLQQLEATIHAVLLFTGLVFAYSLLLHFHQCVLSYGLTALVGGMPGWVLPVGFAGLGILLAGIGLWGLYSTNANVNLSVLQLNLLETTLGFAALGGTGFAFIHFPASIGLIGGIGIGMAIGFVIGVCCAAIILACKEDHSTKRYNKTMDTYEEQIAWEQDQEQAEHERLDTSPSHTGYLD